MLTATYSPEDNKLRLYSPTRLDRATYDRVRAAGFIWAPKQELFVAPMWTPSREDLLLELAGEIGDEDTSLVERQEQRAERFEEYSESRAEDANQAHAAVSRIADGIPLGQPILVGHHSEKHARKDAERIENGMRKAVKMWETSKYWEDRAAGAIAHAKYKERPDVRARRIKGLEADERKATKSRDSNARLLNLFEKLSKIEDPTKQTAIATQITNSSECYLSQCYPLAEFPRELPASQYEGEMGMWSALDGGVITGAQAVSIAIPVLTRSMARWQRWLDHYANRLTYERAMLAAAGGTVTDKTGPEKGGACRCWASHRGGWSYIQKVNKVSVTVLDNWGNSNDKDGSRNFTRTMPFDKLAAVMTRAAVEAARAAGTLKDYEDGTGFLLLDGPPPEMREVEYMPAPTDPAAADFEAMKDSLKAGVQVVTANQLFPTPPDVAARMVELADIKPDHRVLEPSAGTGNLCAAVVRVVPPSNLFAVEINHQLCEMLSQTFTPPDDARQHICRNVLQGDFLECNGNLGKFDRVVMNPPFENGADIKHIQHAVKFLKPGGKLVAICANGPRQNGTLKPMVWDCGGDWEELPEGTFSGTGVRAVLLTLTTPGEEDTFRLE
jgi:protein-L-isoaspartate O-methyltransferase